VAALLSAVLALPVVSVVAPATVTPVAASSNIACSVDGLFNGFMYSFITPNMGNGWTTVRGIQAQVWSPPRLYPCTGTDHTPYDGPSYWISISPNRSADCPAPNAGECIIQIGVINCEDTEIPFPDAACSGTTSHFFWAYGGCNGWVPVARDLGVASGSGSTFRIQRQSNGNWNLTINSAHLQVVSATDSATSCWLSGGGHRATMACENLDPGDGCGDSVNPVTFLAIRFEKAQGGYWYTPEEGGITTQLSCNDISGREHCTINRPDEVRFWHTTS